MSFNLYRNPAIPVAVALLLTASSTLAQTARFLGEDRTTKGNWKNVYGGQGYQIPSDGTLNPSYGSASVAGSFTYSWTTSTADTRALQKIAGGERAATAWYSPVSGSFDINLAFSDSSLHRVAIYCLDWEGSSRTQTIEVRDAATNALLDSRLLSDFTNGAYLRWNLSGNVKLKVVNTGPVDSVVSGIFFDPPVLEPAWWVASNVKTGDAANNRGPANIGQAKWMAMNALAALRGELGETSPVVQAIRNELYKTSASASAGVFFPERPASPTVEWLESQKMPLQIGALKALAAPFYRHLSAVNLDWVEEEFQDNGLVGRGTSYFEGASGILYPWNPEDDGNNEKNHAIATLGQLKVVFSLRFDRDRNSNGFSDLWEKAYFGEGLNPNEDEDGDGLTNLQEYQNRLDPNNPDTDGDGMEDGWEVYYGLPANDGNPHLPSKKGPKDDQDDDDVPNDEEEDRGSMPDRPNEGLLIQSNPLRLEWFGKRGVMYGVESSSNLSTWNYTRAAFVGENKAIVLWVPGGFPSPPIGTFFRLKYFPQEENYDGDGLSAMFEKLILGTDPFLSDTNGDSVNDGTDLASVTASIFLQVYTPLE